MRGEPNEPLLHPRRNLLALGRTARVVDRGGPFCWPDPTVPDEITRVRARPDIAGRYVWHCHVIDHEDNEMMRPYQVG